MNEHTEDSGKRAQAERPPVRIRGTQIFARPPQENGNEPGNHDATDQAAAGKQFQIIVMRLLRRIFAGCIVIFSDRNPVTAKADTANWVGFDRLPRRGPDLLAAGVCTIVHSLLTEGRSCKFEIAYHRFAANPTDTVSE